MMQMPLSCFWTVKKVNCCVYVADCHLYYCTSAHIDLNTDNDVRGENRAAKMAAAFMVMLRGSALLQDYP